MVRRPRLALGRAVGLAALFAMATCARLGHADDASEAQKLAEAKELFYRGIPLYEAGNCDRAVDFFLRSHALVAQAHNTTDAAICLDKLGRYDEALEMSEEVVSRFFAELDAEDKAVVGPMMARLRTKVGSLQIACDVDAELYVDGRLRGRAPLASPLRLLPGKHLLRALKPGFSPFEQAITVAAGETIGITAHLEMAAGLGVLRVEDASLVGGSLFVDGARVGTLPWEGAVPVGRHAIWTEGGDRGSAPAEILIVAGQTSLARPPSRELGNSVRLAAVPITTSLAIDGVVVARGRWEGRLPKGAHEVTATEPGFRTRRATVGDGLAPDDRTFNLSINPNDPRWPRHPLGRFVASGFASYAFASTLHSGAASVSHSDADGTYAGPLGGLRLGYRFSGGIAPEITAGYFSIRGAFGRDMSSTFSAGAKRIDTEVDYHLVDDSWLRGPFGTVGASFTWKLWWLRATSRVAVGVVYTRASDPVHGVAETHGQPAGVAVQKRDSVLGAIPPVVASELGVAYPFRSFDVGLAMATMVVPISGPNFTGRKVEVDGRGCRRRFPVGVGCAPVSGVIAEERSYGPFLLLVPEIFATVPF